MQRPVYAITERNVDGCGGEATEYLSASRPLTGDELETLAGCLGEVKRRHREAGQEEDRQDLDTYDMVQDAARLFLEKTGRELSPADDPLAGRLYF